jgi:hypothetical protein
MVRIVQCLRGWRRVGASRFFLTSDGQELFSPQQGCRVRRLGVPAAVVFSTQVRVGLIRIGGQE